MRRQNEERINRLVNRYAGQRGPMTRRQFYLYWLICLPVQS